MATSAKGSPFKQIMADIRARRFAPVYILSGEEPYYLDVIADAIQQYAIAEDERDMDQHLYYGQDADIDLIINTARQYPFIASHKLLMLREAQTMPTARTKLDKLEPYVSNPSATTILVIHYKGEPLKESSKLVKAAKKNGAVIYSTPKTRDYQLAGLLRDYCADNGITLEPRAAEMLCQSIGTNLQLLYGEVEKLRLSLPEGGHISISADMVASNIGVSKQYNVFELKSAVVRRDYDTCMRIANYYMANPNAKDGSPEQIASALFGIFANLITAHYLPDKSEDSLRKNLGLNFKPQIDELRTGLRNFSAWSCLRIIHAIRLYDCHIKGIGSAQSRSALLIDLIYQIFTL